MLGLDALIGLNLWNPVTGNVPHGESNGIPADRRRNNHQGRLATPEGGQNPLDGSLSGIQFDHRCGNLDAVVVQASPAVESTVGLHSSRLSAILTSSWDYYLRTGVENAIPLAPATNDFLAETAWNVGCLVLLTTRCPMMESEVEGSLVLVAVSDFPTAGGHRHFPVAVTGCLATGRGQRNHRPGCLIGCLPGLET